MKVNIVEWHGFSTWHWNLATESHPENSGYVDELCGICRVAFDGTCPNCKYPGDDCPIVLGSGCTHNFHLHCILKWLEQDTSKGLCPMCRQTFTYKNLYPIMTEELVNLQTLIDGHRVMRERFQTDNEQEFEAFEDEDGEQMNG
ncbi:ubiquitin-protein ligase anaphase promoting complex [Scheffersomyces xylosifermentans]|uniref:ubiquitin-protein ligase anaphase promoting complex n=1 Tax=Scheffersomyces xylosifermentans TaxID=1304137 RepID=UPI00315C972B